RGVPRALADRCRHTLDREVDRAGAAVDDLRPPTGEIPCSAGVPGHERVEAGEPAEGGPHAKEGPAGEGVVGVVELHRPSSRRYRSGSRRAGVTRRALGAGPDATYTQGDRLLSKRARAEGPVKDGLRNL